jgi:glucose-6-phosphate dehydrogenase assembly protein OpcA
MAPDVTSIERLQDEPIAVAPGAIEAEFARIWRETSGDASSVRLRVLNFVAMGSGPRAVDGFEAVMEVLPERQPCRGILAYTSAAQAHLESSISARCWRSASGGRQVCSEEVVLAGAPGQDDAMASAVRALLVPDLPVACWLMDASDAPSDLAGDLLEGADFMFIDSQGAADTAATLRQVRHTSLAHDVHPHDLAWGRLSTWRMLLAQSFDGEERTAELQRVNTVHIEGGIDRIPSEAALIAGWLAARLRLTPASVDVSDDRMSATLYRGTRPVTLRIEPSDRASLRRLAMSSDALTLSVEHHAESGHMHLEEVWTAGSAARRAVDALAADDASVIARMLDDGPDAVYMASVEAALELLGGA